MRGAACRVRCIRTVTCTSTPRTAMSINKFQVVGEHQWEISRVQMGPMVPQELRREQPDLLDQTGPAPTGSGNKVIATPADGSSGISELRTLVSADIPTDLALTGVPTAPTATALSDNTTIANTKYVDDAITAAESGIVSSGAAPPSVTVSTSNDNFTAGERKTYDLSMGKSCLVWKVTESNAKKFRLQLYSTSAARAADASRGRTIPLALGSQHGCILDLYIEQSGAVTPFKLSPPVIGSNNDGTQTTTIYAGGAKRGKPSTQNIQRVNFLCFTGELNVNISSVGCTNHRYSGPLQSVGAILRWWVFYLRVGGTNWTWRSCHQRADR